MSGGGSMQHAPSTIRGLSLIGLCLGMSALAATALAQSTAARGALSGTVRLPHGVVAAGAVVQAKGADEAIYRGTADAAGRYTVADLPPGAYDVSVAIPGVRAFEKKAVQVQAGGKPTEFAIELEEGTQLSTLGEDPRGFAADRARHKPPAGPTPRTADGKPDFSASGGSPS
jgi:hypothetical protein